MALPFVLWTSRRLSVPAAPTRHSGHCTRHRGARRAVRAGQLGAEPQPHQPMAVSRSRRAGARAPDGHWPSPRSPARRSSCSAHPRLSRSPHTRAAIPHRTVRTCWRRRWPPIWCCLAPTPAVWPATGAPWRCWRTRVGERSSGWGRARRPSACSISVSPCRSSACPSGATLRRRRLSRLTAATRRGGLVRDRPIRRRASSKTQRNTAC